ncbi:MAG: BMP family ABC transporter substrate-binding protein [Treponema sp.]|jgi:simple sugar transport system substrate-binding protein|nr:BMP family ABC transporter substrate-binding protein [Treponema sp.]
MKKTIVILLLITVFFTFGCSRKNERASEIISVLVFVTGEIAGSPTYEMMVEGANEFTRLNPNAPLDIKIYEAGRNQAMWEQQLSELISIGEFDVVIGSNPSLPEMCIRVADNFGSMFPDIKFIILDAHHEGHPQIRTYLYNQYEQALVLGYLAGLITTSNMPHTNNFKRIGFIAAQEYPLLVQQKVPGFIEGAKMVDPEIELDFRVIGNWFDVTKAAELASAMINAGVDVFTVNAGGASQGLIRTAIDRGVYMVWFNSEAYHLAPGFIVGCGLVEQERLTIEVLNDVVAGKVEYGKADVLGIKEGYIRFLSDHAGYLDFIPTNIQEKFEEFLDNLLLK